MLASLTALGDFVVDLKWDFTSWVPLVSKMLPSDVCKITKKGQSMEFFSSAGDEGSYRPPRSVRLFGFIEKMFSAEKWQVINRFQG